MIKILFAPAKNSPSANLALLVLRVWIGVEMMVVHGVDKLMSFTTTAQDFPDPLGVGHTASLALAVFAEVLVSMFLVVGLVTRLAALVLIIDMTVAFVCVHKCALSGSNSGELAFLYLLAYVVLLLAGPGRVSADKILFGKIPAGPSRSKS